MDTDQISAKTKWTAELNKNKNVYTLTIQFLCFPNQYKKFGALEMDGVASRNCPQIRLNNKKHLTVFLPGSNYEKDYDKVSYSWSKLDSNHTEYLQTAMKMNDTIKEWLKRAETRHNENTT